MNPETAAKLLEAANAFTDENFQSPTESDYAVIRNAMLSAALVVLEAGKGSDIVQRVSMSRCQSGSPKANSMHAVVDAELAAELGRELHETGSLLLEVKRNLWDYFRALDDRKHGGVSSRRFAQSVSALLGMHWDQGYTNRNPRP